MVDRDSPEFQIGKKIGHTFMVYIGIRLIIKGAKTILKHGKVLFTSTIPTP